MAVTCTGEGRVLRAAISGEVDHHRARAIMEELTFMDSSGIAVLLRAYRRLGELGGAVKVVHVPAQAGKVLRAAGLDKLMEFE